MKLGRFAWNGLARQNGAMSDVTRILSQIESGDPVAAEQLLPLVAPKQDVPQFELFEQAQQLLGRQGDRGVPGLPQMRVHVDVRALGEGFLFVGRERTDAARQSQARQSASVKLASGKRG